MTRKTHEQVIWHPPSPGTIPRICLCLCVFLSSNSRHFPCFHARFQERKLHCSTSARRKLDFRTKNPIINMFRLGPPLHLRDAECLSNSEPGGPNRFFTFSALQRSFVDFFFRFAFGFGVEQNARHSWRVFSGLQNFDARKGIPRICFPKFGGGVWVKFFFLV